ncbi:MAG TPA: radical SAM protein [Candidatus Binatia bacterium]|nr:radical SAM protein [Candidatus Binatia bacterium]
MNRDALLDPTAFRAPLYIAWEITHRCNAECVHCYSASGPGASCAGELTTGEALDVIDQLADAGLLVLAFSGGEPMLRKDWRTLVARAVARGLSVNVGTNGSLLMPRTAEQLQQLGVKSVTVSIDSHRPDVHDRFRGYSGLHARAVRGIQLLVARGIRVVVGFTPTRLNWQDGPGVVELARSLKAAAVNLSEYVPAGRGSIDLALSPAQLRKTLVEWIALRAQYRGAIDLIWHDCRVGMLVPEDERRDYVGCGAGRLVARICPDGTVTPCVFLPTAIGSFRNSTFREMWAGSPILRQFRIRQGFITGNCGSCQHLATCGGCRAVAFAYSAGDPLGGDPHCWVEPMCSDTLRTLPEGEALPV